MIKVLKQQLFLMRKSDRSLLKRLEEKKWNKSADTALQQIEERRYPDSVRSYTGSILLVGINYDTHTKEYTCLIKKYIKEL